MLEAPDFELDLQGQRLARPEVRNSMPYLPIIVGGFTGSGKDTVSTATINLASEAGCRDNFQHSAARYTDRHKRPGEIDGVNGRFVSPEEFNRHQEQGNFFYSYGKYGCRYGFSLPALQNELATAHTFLVGGEADTTIALQKSLHEITRDTTTILDPMIIFINRDVREIVEGIKARPAEDNEKARRIRHVEQHWEEQPKALAGLNGRVHHIWNDHPETAAAQVIMAVRDEVRRQMLNLFGSSASRH